MLISIENFSHMISYFRSIAVGDKFGNISILQLPGNVNDDVREDPTGIRGLWDRGLLSAACEKF